MPGPVVIPYVFFRGRCEEAMEFYARTIGAVVVFKMYHRESPHPHPPGMLHPGFEDKIMHLTFQVGESTVYASDGCDAGGMLQGFKLSLNFGTEAEADAAFARLSEGGTVEMPICKTFWAPRFGMLTDQFGVEWMVQATG